MDPNQNQPNNNIPSVKQPGNWNPWMDFNNDAQPPQKKSFFSKNKKFIIIIASVMVVFLGLIIVASLSDTKSDRTEGATTTVPLSSYEKDLFSMQYPTGLNILNDEKLEEEAGWYLRLAEDSESSPYYVSVLVTQESPVFGSYEQGLQDQLDSEVIPNNVITSDVVVAGYQTKKAVGEIQKEDGKEYYVAFTYVEADGKHVIISAEYQKDNSQIHDSFDAMVGSIEIKTQ